MNGTWIRVKTSWLAGTILLNVEQIEAVYESTNEIKMNGNDVTYSTHPACLNAFVRLLQANTIDLTSSECGGKMNKDSYSEGSLMGVCMTCGEDTVNGECPRCKGEFAMNYHWLCCDAEYPNHNPNCVNAVKAPMKAKPKAEWVDYRND